MMDPSDEIVTCVELYVTPATTISALVGFPESLVSKTRTTMSVLIRDGDKFVGGVPKKKF